MGLTPDRLAEPASTGPAFRPLQAIVALGAIQALTMLAGLARTKVLAVLLGPAGMGIAVVIDQVVGLVTQLGSLSLPFAAVKHLSRVRAAGARPLVRLYDALKRTLLGASAVAMVIALGLAAWRTEILSGELAGYRPAVMIGLLTAPALAMVALQRNVLAAVDRNRQAALFALLGGVALIGSSWAGIRAGGLTGLYAGNLVVYAMLAAVMLRYVERAAAPKPARSSGDTSRESALSVLRGEPGLAELCTVMHFLTLATPLAYMVTHVLVLNHHGATAAGIMAAAYGIAVAMRVVLSQANALYLTPVVNRATPKEERAAAVRDYLRVLSVVLLASGLVLVLFPRALIVLLYSSRFAEAAALVGLFVVSEGILLVGGAYQALLIGFDDLRIHLGISVVAHGCMAAIAVWLIPSLGVAGAGIAFLVAHAVILTASAGRLARRHSVPEVARALRLVSVAVGLIGAAAAWTHLADPGLAWRALACVAAGLACARSLTADERRWLLAPWREVRIPADGGLDGEAAP